MTFQITVFKLFDKSFNDINLTTCDLLWWLLLYLNLLIFLNWCIIALQCRVSFCCTIKWVRYIYIYIYIPFLLSLLPTPPSHPSESESEAIRLCLALCDSIDCSPPGSSGHWIFQAKILGWVAIPFSRESSQPRDWTRVSCMAGRL